MRRGSLILGFLLLAAITTAQQGDTLLNGAISREGGMMTLLKACEPLAKGNVVSATQAATLGIEKCPVDSYDIFGVVYSDASGSSSVASGTWCWIVYDGPAQVLMDGVATAGNIIITSSTTKGAATNVAKPPPPPIVADHFREVGHLLQSKTVATIAWAIVHFN